MAEITFIAFHEGGVSKANTNIGGTPATPFTTVGYLFEDSPQIIAHTDDKNFILLQFRMAAILKKVPTNKTVIFKDKNDKTTELAVFDITVNDTAQFKIVKYDKKSRLYRNNDTKNAQVDLNDTVLKNIVNSIATSTTETINSTDSRPPCN